MNTTSNVGRPNRNRGSFWHGRHGVRQLLGIRSWEEFHDFLIRDSIQRVFTECEGLAADKPTILAICADWKEAAALKQFPFAAITLTGLLPADEKMERYVRDDMRIRYEQQNAEYLSFPSRSFDIVFCKEGLHHLARPTLGLYEMLRTCKHATVFIEGYDGWMNRQLESLGLSSVYENDQLGNIGYRRNYVFRWGKSYLRGILKSYYLDSGWRLNLVSGWMGSRVQLGHQSWLRRIGVTVGWLLSFLPGCEGNYLTAIIIPGSDLPADPRAATV